MPQSSFIKFAVFNVALSFQRPGQLIQQLATKSHRQTQNIAEIIQRVQPDVLALLEFDYDESAEALRLLQSHYLSLSQQGQPPIFFKYFYVFPSNTGIPSGFDLNRDGKTTGPDDALGFGLFPGQYAFALLSKYPILWQEIRQFQTFLWRDMPHPHLPTDPVTQQPWYSSAMLDCLRLSSKNHVDVPIQFNDGVIHTLIAHPCPPAFDGEEKRNQLRNQAEIRLLLDYITPQQANYLYDTQGHYGGLPVHNSFVILGDLNADPATDQISSNMINQLLHAPTVHPLPAIGDKIPRSQGAIEYAQMNKESYGNPAYLTTSWQQRVDYVLPSADLKIGETGVFWPDSQTGLSYLVAQQGDWQTSSDHRLVWAEVMLT